MAPPPAPAPAIARITIRTNVGILFDHPSIPEDILSSERAYLNLVTLVSSEDVEDSGVRSFAFPSDEEANMAARAS